MDNIVKFKKGVNISNVQTPDPGTLYLKLSTKNDDVCELYTQNTAGILTKIGDAETRNKVNNVISSVIDNNGDVSYGVNINKLIQTDGDELILNAGVSGDDYN